jgi:hypothetical protein
MTDPDRRPDADPDEPRPWERPGAVRRDVEPHRGQMLMLLGLASGFLALSAPMVAMLPSLVSFPVGVTVVVLARRDSARMHAGHMDPEGLSYLQWTRLGAWCGILVPLLLGLEMVVVVGAAKLRHLEH